MLRLYYADIRELPDQAEQLPLSDYRRERLRDLRPAQKRRQGIGAELLLIHALTELDPRIALPLRIEVQPGGKPRLTESPLCFSLSHSGDLSACAVADRPIGLDIQMNTAYRERLAARCFTEEERRILLSSPDRDYAFTMLWTLKESYLKAIGCGLRMPMRELSVAYAAQSEDAGSVDTRFRHAYRDGCHFAVCRPGEDEVEPFEIEKIELL
ncbi:MAG: 4'-phosphopantetheinyl transferase superfamily protein [Oscillospiraceae bacterium]|nr:4'-phosphopantetheinyl transferase superfamily protein [Oscillospiraceae bacterium]